jgi:hypothetical protein
MKSAGNQASGLLPPSLESNTALMLGQGTEEPLGGPPDQVLRLFIETESETLDAIMRVPFRPRLFARHSGYPSKKDVYCQRNVRQIASQISLPAQ